MVEAARADQRENVWGKTDHADRHSRHTLEKCVISDLCSRSQEETSTFECIKLSRVMYNIDDDRKKRASGNSWESWKGLSV